MQKTKKTKAQLQEELADCRQRIGELEASEQAFRRITESYQDYFDNIEDGCFEVDLQGDFLFGNKKAYTLLGYDLDDYKKVSHRQRHPTTEEANRVFRVFNDLYKTGKPIKSFEYQIIRKDGEIKTVEVSVTLIRDADGHPVGFRGVGRDVSERKKLERDQERHRNFIENIDDSCVEFDLQGHCIFCNEATHRNSGYTRDEFMALRHDERYISSEEDNRVFHIFNKIYQTGISEKLFIANLKNKDGSSRSVEMSISLIRDAAGNPVGFRGVGRDVTERVEMMKVLERYRDFIENVEDACFEMDLEGNLTFANDIFSKIVGYSNEEFGKLKREQRHPSVEEAEKIFKVYRKIFRTGKPLKTFEYDILRKDGAIRTVEVSISLIRDGEANPVGFRSIGRDITNRKRMMAEMERHRDFVENIEDACFEVDLKGNITFTNNTFGRILGRSREDVIGLNNRAYTNPATAQRAFKIFNEIYRTGLPGTILDYEIIRPDGESKFLEMTASLIRDDRQQPAGFRGICRDVTERRQMLKEQERHRNFIENIEDACFEMDPAGKITFGNESLQRLTGYSIEELCHLKPRDLQPKDVEKIRAIYGKIYQTGEPVRLFDYELTRKDGKKVNVQASVSLIRNSEGNPVGFRGISRDVTERKAAEKEQERSRNFIENIDDACWELNLAGDYTFCNPAAYKNLGFTREEYMALKRQQRAATPEENDRISKIFNEIYRTGIPRTGILFQHLNKAGEMRLMDMSVSLIRDDTGTAVGFRGISRDVTERKQIEIENERYRAFVDNIDDGCFEIDLAGRHIFSNDAVLEQLGYPADEIKKITVKDYTRPEETDRIYKAFQNVYRTGNPLKVLDHEIIRKNGEIRMVEVSASLIRDAAGKPVGFRGVNRDVTERKRLTNQLNQAQKLEAIGTLAGGIAHDFNNLLMGIQGYTSLMMLEIDSAHPNFEKLKAIESQVKSGADLTKQLLGYARGGRYEVKAIDMNDLIGKAAAMFGRTKKELRIHKNFAQDLWSVEADKGQMEQVLLNLFVNAWQAMPGGGALYLETGNIMLDEAYLKAFDIQPGPYVKISVTDTGMGMDEATKSRIFDPFFTTKEMGRGAGLGLASVYGIVRGHKGAIHVYSEKGHGATFNIYLPASGKDAIIQEDRAGKLVRGHETILLVDDEQIITDVTGAMIRGLGYEVIIAQSGEEAVEVYMANQARIDLVIMDMIMPGAGGGTAIDKIHAINPGIKIILSSGYSLNGEAKHIMDRGGARAFLQKPFPFEDLSQKIREVLES